MCIVKIGLVTEMLILNYQLLFFKLTQLAQLSQKNLGKPRISVLSSFWCLQSQGEEHHSHINGINGLHNGTEKISNGSNSVNNGHNGCQNAGVKINNNFSKSKNTAQIVENGNGLEYCSGESKYHPEPSPKVCILIT